MGIREIEIAAKSIIIHELDNVCDSITGCPLTGSWLWRSAIVLAEFMSTHLHFQTKSVLELGAGAGLPGLTAARLGATRVVLTDIQLLLPGLINNVVANGLEDRVEVRELVWGSDESARWVGRVWHRFDEWRVLWCGGDGWIGEDFEESVWEGNYGLGSERDEAVD